MNAWNLGVLCGLMEESGRIALRHFSEPHTEFKPDRSVVTLADAEIEQFLTGKLADDETSFILGEETCLKHDNGYFRKAFKNTVWIIDPIDGTALYANKIGNWGISVGFARNGVMEEGAVFFPETGDFIASANGCVWYASCGTNPNSWRIHSRLRRVDFRPNPVTDASLVCVSQRMAKQGLYSGRQNLQTIGSCVFPGLQLVLGHYSAFIMRAHIWDFAGFLPLLKKLGFHSVRADGANLLSCEITEEFYDLDVAGKDPFLCCSHSILAASQEDCGKIREFCTFPEER